MLKCDADPSNHSRPLRRNGASLVLYMVVAALSLFRATALAAPACDVPPVTITHPAGVSTNGQVNQAVFITGSAALCNDGSQAAFIVRKGLAPSQNRWIITLQGGGDCTTAAACVNRLANDPQLTGTGAIGRPGAVNKTAVQKMMQQGSGILSPDAAENPDFWDANVVQVLYCSSDLWTGGLAGVPISASQKFNFKGRAILLAVINLLKNPSTIASYGLNNFNAATEVLFMGTSAGAAGTYENINDAAPLMPAGARFLVMADSGFYDSSFPAFNPLSTVPPYLGLTGPTAMQQSALNSFSLWGGRGDLACNSQAATAQAQMVACRSTSYIMNGGYVQVPTFIVQSNYDLWQLTEVEGVTNCELFQSCAATTSAVTNARAAAYVSAFASNLLNQIKATRSAAPTAGMVLQYPLHVLTTTSKFTENFPLNSGAVTTVSQVFGAWYRAPCASANERIFVTRQGQQ